MRPRAPVTLSGLPGSVGSSILPSPRSRGRWVSPRRSPLGWRGRLGRGVVGGKPRRGGLRLRRFSACGRGADPAPSVPRHLAEIRTAPRTAPLTRMRSQPSSDRFRFRRAAPVVCPLRGRALQARVRIAGSAVGRRRVRPRGGRLLPIAAHADDRSARFAPSFLPS
jgi:hypothetical protein